MAAHVGVSRLLSLLTITGIALVFSNAATAAERRGCPFLTPRSQRVALQSTGGRYWYTQAGENDLGSSAPALECKVSGINSWRVNRLSDHGAKYAEMLNTVRRSPIEQESNSSTRRWRKWRGAVPGKWDAAFMYYQFESYGQSPWQPTYEIMVIKDGRFTYEVAIQDDLIGAKARFTTWPMLIALARGIRLG